MNSHKINFITRQFFYNSVVLNVDSIESGLINKTYIVECLLNGEKFKYVLQRLSNIFESHELVNMNHKLVTDHIKKKINKDCIHLKNIRSEVPCLIRCDSNNLFLLPFDSYFWRAMVYINDTFSLDILEDNKMAYQVGIGLARFHSNCSDFDLNILENSIKNFHNTNYYLNRFNIIIKTYNFIDLNENIRQRVQSLILNLSSHIDNIRDILLNLKNNSIDLSVIHGDPKLSNFLFDIKYKYVVSLIDLDTVSSGYLLTDLADCLRSICNIAGEDPDGLEYVHFDVSRCVCFLKGYFSIQKQKFNYYFELIPEYIYLLIVELTIRFLSDFLQSNKYFKVNYKTHNLYRAEVQFQLLSSFVKQVPALINALHELGIFATPTFLDVQKIV